MAVAREKILVHSRSRDQNLQRGWRFIQNGGYSEKSEKIWVQDMAKVKINKMVEKAEVFFLFFFIIGCFIPLHNKALQIFTKISFKHKYTNRQKCKKQRLEGNKL